MSVIQTIRNKYLGLMLGLIVLALIGFLVMDAMQSNVRTIFGGDQSLLAEINGTRIEYKEFAELQTRYEENMKNRNKDKTLSDEDRNQASEQAWSDIITETLIGEESEALGLTITDKEFQDMLTGPYADPMVKQSFTDPNTGIFDPSKVSQYLNSLSQDKTGVERQKWRDFENALLKQRKVEKYNELIVKGIYIPNILLSKIAKDNSATANIEYVQIPYAAISDSITKVSEDEIKAYMQKNEKLFKTFEPIAKAEYISFDILPSTEDTTEVLNFLTKIKPELDTTNDLEALIANNSEESLRDFYYSSKNVQYVNPEEIINAPINTVIGPYYFNGTYRLAKVLDKKQMPDSVKASHILIAINEQRDEKAAEASIDSIEQMIKAGANFEQLAMARSEDQGSGKQGGDLGYFAQGTMVPEFNDACFYGKTGDMKKVKTQFGFHLIKVTDQKDFKPSVKLAIISKTLAPGSNTIQKVFAEANELLSKSKNAKQFTENAKKAGKDKRVADRITQVQRIIPGLGNARELSRWMYEAKIGEISPIFNLEDKLIIANLVSRQQKGEFPDVESVRPQVENIIRREKKTKMADEKYKGKSLEEIASLNQVQVQKADSMSYGQGNEALSYEPKVIGAAFNANNLNKVSKAIGGEQGIYFVKTTSTSKGTENADPMMQMMMKSQLSRQVLGQADQIIPYVLKRNAKIDDKRNNHF